MWRARPVFVSSTFEDFQAERDHLRNYVFPELEERLRGRRRHLEWVDLRIGVSTHGVEDTERRETEILKVCLTEVERCRPFLLVLLGDRYGWTPGADRVRAAAQEAAVKIETVNVSVTELEILAGAFSTETPRVLFYMREALDYRGMPNEVAALYSSERKGDSKGDQQLRALKRRIEAKFGDRVRRYSVRWDETRQRPAGLEVWGRAVLEDLWRELAADVGEAREVTQAYNQLERDALEEFIEDRARDFVGREKILGQLERLAFSRSSALGVCVTGGPGAGKSALFGSLVRKFAGSNALVLAHAAGASPGAASVNAMLRRWIEELGDPTPGSELSDSELEMAFDKALQNAARRQRVVIMIDALDQFESTARARQFAWSPKAWPANVRIVVTGIPCSATRAVSAIPGVASIGLAPLSAADGRALIRAISARYHRALEPSVISALVNVRAGSAFGHANPLWLVLAAEEINLVDADDLARAKRNYRGSPAEQLRAMMVDAAAALPGDVPGLYETAFKHADELFGAPFVRAFLQMIAVSRGGWRERDFSAVMPRLCGEGWNALRFASMRRLFRGQMRTRGRLQQWDFSHAQMRIAALAKLDLGARRRVHGEIASHLLGLPEDDPLRISEVMAHLLACEDWPRAAKYAANFSLAAPAAEAAAGTMIDALLAAPDGDWAPAPPLVNLMNVADVQDRYRAAQRFQYEVVDHLAHRDALPLARRLALHRIVHDAFARLGGPVEGDIRWYSHVSAAGERIAEDHLKMGDLAAAEPLLRECVRVGGELAAADPDYGEWNRDLSVAFNKLGAVLQQKGDLAAALEAYKSGLEQIETALRKDPQADWARDLAISQSLVGKLERRIGSARMGHEAVDRAGAATVKLAAERPEDLRSQLDLAHHLEESANRLLVEGLLDEAKQNCRRALETRERVYWLDPSDGYNRRNLARAWSQLAHLLELEGATKEATDALSGALSHASGLAAADPANIDWADDAARIRISYARSLAALGKIAEATDALWQGETEVERLVQKDAERPAWIEYRAQAQSCAAAIYDARKEVDAAEKAWRAAAETRRRCLALEASRPRRMALANTLFQLGEFLWRRRDLPQSETALREALGLFAGLIRDDARDVSAVQAMATAHGVVGEVKGAMGAHREALTAFLDSKRLLERATEAAPQLVGVRKNLAISMSNIAHAHLMLGDADEAAAWRARAIAIMEPFADGERDRAMLATWRSQGRGAEFLTGNRGDSRAQEAWHIERVGAIEREHGEVPRDATIRQELYSLYEALRTVQSGGGDLEGAQRSYQKMRLLVQRDG